ncbi:MAG: hypothetical protein IJP86_06250 [Synergistaceae bacterium]|nr:hypothetical protein [Synergistaceae bacterium]
MKRALLLLMMMGAFRAEGWELSGTWNIYGTGFVEKSFVRISLGLTGNMELTKREVSELSDDVAEILSNDTVTVMNRRDADENLDCLTGYDIGLRVYALDKSGLDVKIWDDNLPNGIRIPIVYPELEPTLSEPFTLPAVTDDGLTYQVTFNSENAGKVRIKGYIDTSIGDIELNSDCAIWKQGTARPSTESETKSGCDSGMGITALMMMLLAGVKKFVRN